MTLSVGIQCTFIVFMVLLPALCVLIINHLNMIEDLSKGKIKI